MKLSIRNLGKIKDADIEINGITIIAGNNNTGKSTVGKSLFSIFNSVYNINEKIENSRKREIFARCRGKIRSVYATKDTEDNNLSFQRSQLSRKIEMASRDFSRLMQNEKENIFNVEYLVDKFVLLSQKHGLPISESIIETFSKEIEEDLDIVNGTDDFFISIEIIERFFSGIFSNQICNLTNTNSSELKLEIHNQDISFLFKENRCVEWSNNFEIMHEAFFVDDPFVVDGLGDMWDYSYGGLTTRDFLMRQIELSTFDEQESVISSVLAKEKVREIEKIIDNVVPEDISRQNGEWVVTSDSYLDSIHVDNLSAGVKSFLLLKLLLERGILKEKDVLILDEPEIHLHPEWQIKYAEIIVLLQKMFDLSILVTTHSRDFFEAIDLFSKKYNVSSKCKFYLSKQVENEVEFVDVSDDTSCIYKHLVDPSRLLDKLKFELEECEDE